MQTNENTATTQQNTAQQENDKPTVVLGAGIAGLRCAQRLSDNQKVLLLEKRKQIGGLTTSFEHKEFTFDIGPHKIYSILPGIMPQFRDILGENCLIVNKKNSIYLREHAFRFPLNPLELATHFSPFVAAHCGLSYASTIGRRKAKDYIISYEDYFLNGFGKAAYELMFRDIAQKVWGDPKKLSADLAERRIPVPSIIKIAQQLFAKKTKPEVSATQFYYPRNGMGSVTEQLAKEIKRNRSFIYTETTPTAIEVRDSTAVSVSFKTKEQERRVAVDQVVSTIHLVDLVSLIKPTPPQEIIDAAKNLKYRSLILVYLILNKPKALDDHWIFFPEKKYCFTRVSEQKNFSASTAPENKTAIIAEVGCEFEDETYKLPDSALFEKVVQDLEKANLIKKEDVEEYFTIKINRCYPVYEIGYKENLTKVLDYIDSIKNIYTIGRQGLFNYNNADHSLDMANKLAEHIIQNKPKEEWKQTRTSFDDYRIVD